MGLAPNADAGERGIVGRVRRLLPGPAYELASVACNGLEYEAVRRVVADFRPDLLYKRHARNDVAALAIAARRGITTVLEVNCLYSNPGYIQFEPLTFPWITARLERRALSLASLVVAVSSPLAQQVRDLGINSVETVPNGANAVTFRPSGTDPGTNRSRLGLPDTLTIGWAGILRDWHGLDLLLDALTYLPGVTLVVIGDGPGADGRGSPNAAAGAGRSRGHYRSGAPRVDAGVARGR
jgi:glycosyltransferase involved in cell wall biosynthesis